MGENEVNKSRRTIIDRQTLLPIGLIMSLLVGVWFASALNSRVKINTMRVIANEAIAKENPSRTEFDDLKRIVQEISTDVKTLLTNK